ncbi:MAG: ATP cone domain-containing protein [Candidatus Paceibacterota bacterium]
MDNKRLKFKVEKYTDFNDMRYNYLMKEILIVKNDGTRQVFEPEKLRQSLRRSGAHDETVEKVVEHVSGEIKDGMTTSYIYDEAFHFLHRLQKPVAARYSLRRALSDLGPTGFPFERYVAEIMKVNGYEILTDQTVQGACVDHEIDVIAWNEDRLVMIEAKFHNEFTFKSDLKAALYIKARFDDIKEVEFDYGGKRYVDEGWLITNTKFTEKAIKYSECAGVKLVGWNYPEGKNLHNMIIETGLHPITCLTTLSNSEKKVLLDRGVILCKSIRENKTILENIGIKGEMADRIVKEAEFFAPVS